MALSQGRQAETARQAAESQRKVAEVQRAVAERERARAESRAPFRSRAAYGSPMNNAIGQYARAPAPNSHLTELLDLADRTLFDIHDAIAALPGAVEARQRSGKYHARLPAEPGKDARPGRSHAAGAEFRLSQDRRDPRRSPRPQPAGFRGGPRSYRKAETVLAPLYSRRQNDPAVILRWLQIERSLADLTNRNGRPREAAQAYAALLPAAHRLGQLGPSNVEWAKQEAETLHSLSYALRHFDDMQGSLARADQAISALVGSGGQVSSGYGIKRELGSEYASAASSLADDPPAAAGYFERSIQIREQILQARPEDMVLRRDLIVVYGNYSRLLDIGWGDNPGRHEEARTYCRKSVALARELAKSRSARYDRPIRSGSGAFASGDGGAGCAGSVRVARCLAGGHCPHRTRRSAGIRSRPASLCSWPSRKSLPGGGCRVWGRRPRPPSNTGSLWPRSARVPRCSRVFLIVFMQLFTDEEAMALLDAGAGDHAAARPFADSALARAQAFADGDPKSERRIGHLAKAYFVLASVSRAAGDKEQARDSAVRALSLWRTTHNPSVLAAHRQAREDAEAMLREMAGGHP